MDEAKYENAMQIILHAGNARSAALMAIDDAAEGDFSAAGAHLVEAQKELHDAHERQFSLIQSEVKRRSRRRQRYSRSRSGPSLDGHHGRRLGGAHGRDASSPCPT